MTQQEMIQRAVEVRNAHQPSGSAAQTIRASVQNVMSNENVYDAMKRLSRT